MAILDTIALESKGWVFPPEIQLIFGAQTKNNTRERKSFYGHSRHYRA